MGCAASTCASTDKAWCCTTHQTCAAGKAGGSTCAAGSVDASGTPSCAGIACAAADFTASGACCDAKPPPASPAPAPNVTAPSAKPASNPKALSTDDEDAASTLKPATILLSVLSIMVFFAHAMNL